MCTFFCLSHHGDVFRESEKDSGMSSRGKAGTETILLGSAQTAEQKPKKERESGGGAHDGSGHGSSFPSAGEQ